MNLTVRKSWFPTNPSQAATGATISVVRDDTQASILSTTAMTEIAAGVFSYTLTNIPWGTTFTATIIITYGAGLTYTESQVVVPEITPEEICWPYGLKKILDHLVSLLALITLKPKPSYSVESESYQWEAYQAMLGQQLENITKLYIQQQPFEIVTGNEGK